MPPLSGRCSPPVGDYRLPPERSRSSSRRASCAPPSRRLLPTRESISVISSESVADTTRTRRLPAPPLLGNRGGAHPRRARSGHRRAHARRRDSHRVALHSKRRIRSARRPPSSRARAAEAILSKLAYDYSSGTNHLLPPRCTRPRFFGPTASDRTTCGHSTRTYDLTRSTGATARWANLSDSWLFMSTPDLHNDEPGLCRVRRADLEIATSAP